MTYKSLNTTVASPSHFVNALKDFMVTCGWTLVGPSTDMVTQEDPYGLLLGWFLKSTGEDGKQEIYSHLGGSASATTQPFASCSYLTGAISSSDTSMTISDTTMLSSGDFIRVGDEVVMVGVATSGVLTTCARGYGQSVAASHSAGEVVQKLTGYFPSIEVYAHMDFTNPIASSTGGPYTVTAAGSVSTVAGLDGYGDDGLSGSGGTSNGCFGGYTCLAKLSNGKYRWVNTYATAGTFSMQPFKQDQTLISLISIYPGGFLPAWSRRRTVSSGTYFFSQLGNPRAYLYASGMQTWFYGSKNSVVIVTKNATNYDIFYFGNVATLSSPFTALTTVTTHPVLTSTLTVDSAAIFVAGQKLRIIGRSVDDWKNNRTRYLAGGWPNLDAEEMPTEEVIVQSVDYGTNVLTLTAPTLYTYLAGAVIGEDPRPAVRQSSNEFDASSGDWYSPGMWPCYLPCDKTVIGSHASHRQTFRAMHKTADRKLPGEGDSTNTHTLMRHYLTPSGLYSYSEQNNKNFQNNLLPLRPLFVGFYRDNVEAGMATWGIFLTMKGFLNHVFYCVQAPPGAATSSGDTILVQWNGEWKPFRVFYGGRTSQLWYAFGPEIA